MPFLATDVEQGQVAGLNLALNPQRAEQEAIRLPLETQRLQQQVAGDALKTQKDSLEVQKALSDQKANSQSLLAIQKFYADPATKSMSIPDQQEALANIVMGQGNFKLGETFLDHAEKARERIDRGQELKAKNDDFALGRIHDYLSTITPDNIDEKIMQMNAEGVLKPKQATQLGLTAHQAALAGGDTFDKWKQETLGVYHSHADKLEADKQAQLKEANRLAQERIDSQERRSQATNDRLVAAIGARDEAGLDKVSTDLYKTAQTTYRDANIVLKNNAKAKEALGKDPGKAWFGKDSDKKIEWDKQRLELAQEEESARESVKNAKEDMTRARSLMSPKVRSALGEAAPTRTPRTAAEPTKGAGGATFDTDAGFKATDAQEKDIGNAMKAIQSGKDPKAVVELLRKNGILVTLKP